MVAFGLKRRADPAKRHATLTEFHDALECGLLGGIDDGIRSTAARTLALLVRTHGVLA